MLRNTAIALVLSATVCASSFQERDSDVVERGSHRVVSTMIPVNETDEKSIPIKLVLDGRSPQNVTLICLVPSDDRPIVYRYMDIAYSRVLEDGQYAYLGRNNFPDFGIAAVESLDDGDIGMSWTLINLQPNEAGKYYCSLKKSGEIVAFSVFQITLIEPARRVRFVATESAKVVGQYVQIKDRTPYHLRCEIDGGKPYLKPELIIDGGTRREAMHFVEKESGMSVIEESGITLYEDLVKISCEATVSETSDFDRNQLSTIKRVTKDEKFLQVLYAPHVVECLAESSKETPSGDLLKATNLLENQFVIPIPTELNAVVCFVQADPDLDALFWVLGPDNHTLRNGESHPDLSIAATISKKHDTKTRKNVSVYEARLQFADAAQQSIINSFSLKAESHVANVTAVIRLQDRTAMHGASFSSSSSSLSSGKLEPSALFWLQSAFYLSCFSPLSVIAILRF